MENTVICDLYLDKLNEELPDLADGKASMMREACVWCLQKCEHTAGVHLDTTFCDDTGCYKIIWDESKIDATKLIKSYNLDDAVEFGAEAISLLLIKKQTPFTSIERSVRGSGIDYWLGFRTDDPNSLFSKKDARLEVSGILKENLTNTIKTRIKRKIQQTEPTDNMFPVYISIVEFGNPKAKVIKRDANH